MQKFVEKVQRVELALGTLAISIFFIAILIQVFGRYTGITVMWTDEVSTYSFTWAVFMGAGAMTYEKKHFAFDSLLNVLTGKKRVVLEIIISAVIMIFSIAILYYGVEITTKFWNYRWITLPDIKMGYTWLCVPILGATTTLYGFSHMVEHIRNLIDGGKK